MVTDPVVSFISLSSARIRFSSRCGQKEKSTSQRYFNFLVTYTVCCLVFDWACNGKVNVEMPRTFPKDIKQTSRLASEQNLFLHLNYIYL